MGANKKPRKPYRPKPVCFNTMELASDGARIIPAAQLAKLHDEIDLAVRDLFAGVNASAAIRAVAAALNMSCTFSEMGFKVDARLTNDGLRAIKAIAERTACATRHEEREAILMAIAAHHAQTRAGMTIRDYDEARKTTARRLAGYLKGNVPEGHLVVKTDAGMARWESS